MTFMASPPSIHRSGKKGAEKGVRNRKTTFLHQCTRNRFLTPYLSRVTGIRSWLCALRLQGETFFRKDASVRHVAASESRSSSRSSSTVFNSASNARAAIPKRASRNLSMAFRVVSRVHSALSSSSNGDSIMALRPPASRRNLLSEGRERATRGGKREQVVKPILVDRLQLRLQCPGSDPKASFEEFEYGFSGCLPRPFGFEFLEQLLEQRGFDHGFAPSQELEQLRVMIPQTGQKLGHGQQIFVLIGRRV